MFKINGTTVMTKQQVGDSQLIAFCASWAALYIGVRFFLLPQRSAVFCKRVVSLVHTAAAVLLSLRALRKEPFAHFGHQPTRDEVPPHFSCSRLQGCACFSMASALLCCQAPSYAIE